MDVPHLARRRGDGALEHLGVALQRLQHIGLDHGVAIGAQHFGSGLALQRLGGAAKEFATGLVDETVALLLVPIADGRGQVVQDGAQVVLCLLQLAGHLLATPQLAREQDGQAHATGHEHQGKKGQLQGALAPVGQNHIGRLGDVHHQGIRPHMPKGIETLHTIQRSHPHEAARALRQKPQHVRRTGKGLAHMVIPIGITADDGAATEEQVHTAARPQVQ